MNIVNLVFEDVMANYKRDQATRKRRATMGKCVECGHDEMSHVWNRDGSPCTRHKCDCPSFYNGLGE